MIKKLLKKFFRSFSFNHDRQKIEKYLSESTNTYELELRIRELDRSGHYNKFYF